MTRSLSIAWYIRVTLLWAAFLGAWVLHRWHLQHDPRFYRFVESPSGSTLARVFSWHESRPPVPFSEKNEREMTPEEIAIKRTLEEAAAADFPTHRLELTDGDEWLGRVIEERPGHVVFSESYGSSGSLSVTVPRSRIRALAPVVFERPLISYRDVRFRMEFPDLQFYKRSPYSIMTDESYFRVEATVDELLRLYREFMVVFGELVSSENRSDDIQVLFFSKEKAFRVYQEKYAPHMPNSTGFYNAWVDRLVVFNQETAGHVSDARERAAQAEVRYREQYAGRPGAQEQIDAWRRQTDQEIAHFAEAQTMNTVRHEGAHQLFFSLGVHSRHRIENEWLYEGLAVYCEPRRFGDKDPIRVRMLREAYEAGRLLPLADLINLRHANGLNALDHPRVVELAYAQVWSLVRFLMQPPRREAFFDYIRYIRDPAHFQDVRRTPGMDLLIRFLEVSPERFEEQWLDSVRHL